MVRKSMGFGGLDECSIDMGRFLEYSGEPEQASEAPELSWLFCKIFNENEKLNQAEFERKDAENREILKAAGFDFEALSAKSRHFLDTLVESSVEARSSGIEDLKKAIGKLKIAHHASKLETYRLKQALEELQLKKLAASTHFSRLKSSLEFLRRNQSNNALKISEWESNIRLLGIKHGDYDKHLAQLKSQFEQSGVEKNQLDDDHMAALMSRVETLEVECATLNSEITAYQNLPPDVTLANLVVEEKKHLLKNLEAERQAFLAPIMKSIQ